MGASTQINLQEWTGPPGKNFDMGAYVIAAREAFVQRIQMQAPSRTCRPESSNIKQTYRPYRLICAANASAFINELQNCRDLMPDAEL